MEKTLILNHPRYKQLDSLRGLAAMAVFIGHYLSIASAPLLLNKIGQSPAGVFYNGYASVIFFFVLSGFVLSLPFVTGAKPLNLTSFYIKRLFRIYPVFIIAILISLLLKQFLYNKDAMASSRLWLSQFWTWDWNKQTITETLKTFLLIGPNFNTRFIDAPMWSLIIEMKMSIILPFLIRIASRNGVTLNIAFLFIISYLTYMYMNWEVSVFYSGILLAKYKDALIKKVRQWPGVISISIMLGAILLYNSNYEFLATFRHLSSPYNTIISSYFIAAGSCIIIIIALAKEKVARFFEWRPLVFLGTISYSFYLIHFPLLITLSSILYTRFEFSPLYILLSVFSTALILSYLMFVLIERPFQRVGSKLIKGFKFFDAISI